MTGDVSPDMKIIASRYAVSLDQHIAKRYQGLGAGFREKGLESSPPDKQLLLEAVKTYQKAISFDPNNFYLFWALGKAFQSLGRHEDAIKTLNKSIELKKEIFPGRYFDLSNSLIELRRYAESLETLENYYSLASSTMPLKDREILEMYIAVVRNIIASKRTE